MTSTQIGYGLLLCALLLVLAVESKSHISVILVGATGDLAKKYLWQGLFQSYVEQFGGAHSLSFYGGTRLSSSEGAPAMYEILKGLSCLSNVPSVRCALLKDQFLKLTQYHQLDTLEDYSVLNKKIKEVLAQEGLDEEGRLFYLSVPAFAYADIATKINATCRPRAGPWLRVVLEKPFGHDLGSAQRLAEALQKVLREEEMYRIDHYLGKQAIAHILPFRHDNRHSLDPIWNQHHVERVEIVLKETLDSKGRTSFYEQYGVICDVIQNHLTEILTFVAMETPVNISDSEEIHRNKMKVYASLEKLDKRRAVTGQYQAYNAEVRHELQKPADYTSKVPTFAGIAMFLDSPQWDNVPFILTAGKALDERVGYTRIVFKNQAFCLQNESTRKAEFSQCKQRQIIFYVGHGDLNFPAILVSKNLFKPVIKASSWKQVTEFPDVHMFGLPLSDYYIYTPVMQKDAYAVLIPQILQAKRDSFVNTEDLLASWKVWTPLLKEHSNLSPRLYPGGAQNGDLLDFSVAGRVVSFSRTNPVEIISQNSDHQRVGDYQVIESNFRGSTLVSAKTEELIAKLASYLQKAAQAAVQGFGRFHLAISGGSSPISLFQRLAAHHYTFPWKHTHFWMVDERCVPLNDPKSNFRSLHDHLLKHLKIPYVNIHPMPVHMNQRLCVEEDHGADLYANEIKMLVNGASFDFVLLGTGADGHTASLFPNSQALTLDHELVLFSESSVKPHQRMTLSLTAINKAKNVAVLITGKSKHPIVSKMRKEVEKPLKWPVTMVRPSDGNLLWFIDYDALLG
ncbi:GDH/6PGL endoplasmic bifunctional protein [Carcharodon carcharias]|uniref:GDH/6PGL endoplasmic bifunctional protein n=1 Tax=Carcharodon carcharias TaxID=13397 RepID=UPI001B7ED0AD|nr:GDH/6PGL endoplasmic bifunctional protein [Carcharodon carcharias]XP_041062289.1 GDH/6PGL endoplasmic bifunctional protein [Carcharodon carcharias]XP_041062290.1 GDH/6PGL endoplasmic bifunctional protein [Carcharodon carcharias]XP_041062291.1 GDH/6PGL endoplasmic bifunctional protein [Carcharodon carcharias]XP_041062292.1 GDH/6PGL endoplasmic bifunctional protein [Carcharodon carcharias]